MRLSLWEALVSPHDDRKGLGIGSAGSDGGFFKQRQWQSTYPYIQPDEDEEEIDEEEEEEVEPIDQARFRNKTGRVGFPDRQDVKKTDPFYFTASASLLNPMGEAIVRNPTKMGMVPPQNLQYRKNGPPVGGTKSGPPSYYGPAHRPIGTKHGTSRAPAPIPDELFLQDDEKNSDISLIQNIRDIVKAYHAISGAEK